MSYRELLRPIRATLDAIPGEHSVCLAYAHSLTVASARRGG
ncbi:MAG TPA: hypothetical protein VGP02_08325 [Mycobacteriales bacterium]|nr:hypothetical protein [Mycobacteriales bacterium]